MVMSKTVLMILHRFLTRTGGQRGVQADGQKNRCRHNNENVRLENYYFESEIYFYRAPVRISHLHAPIFQATPDALHRLYTKTDALHRIFIFWPILIINNNKRGCVMYFFRFQESSEPLLIESFRIIIIIQLYSISGT